MFQFYPKTKNSNFKNQYAKGRLALKKVAVFLIAFFVIQEISAQSGSALHFEGVNDYIDFPVSLTNDNESQTVELWFKYSSLPNFNKPIVIRGDDGFGGWNIQLQLRTDGKLQAYKCCMATSNHPIGTTTLSANTWYHLAMTHNASNGNLIVYINGNVEMTGTYSTENLRNSSVGYRFGRDNLAWPYGGASTGHINQFIDEIQVWNTERSQSQIQSDASGQVAPYSSSLKLYSKLDEGTPNGNNTGLSNTIVNETGNGNGTMYNFAKNGTTSNWVSLYPLPTIASLTPTSTCAGSGANIIITGTNFTGATSVQIGGTNVGSFVVNSATQITAVLGSNTTGLVTVTTPNGTATSSGNFTVNTASSSTTNLTICSSQLPYSWNGLTFNAAGSQTAHLMNSVGCDSSATLNLTVNSSSTSTTNVTICSNQLPYSWNSTNYNAAGTYTYTSVNSIGCDSVATLNLTVNATSSSTTNVTICSNQLPYSWNGTNYNAAGTYTYTTVNSVGCDSVATLNLTVNATSASTSNVTICSNQLPYNWNGTNYNAAGTYTYTTANSVGCDSVATLNLTVNASPTVSVTPSGPTSFCNGDSVTLTASTNDSYLWSNGATTQPIVVKTSGTYSVTVTAANGCSATSTNTPVTVYTIPLVDSITGLTTIEVLAIGGGGGAGGPDGPVGAGGGAGGVVYSKYNLPASGSKIFTVGVGGGGGFGQGCSGNAPGGTAGINGGGIGGNAGFGGCSGGGGGGGGWSGLFQGTNYFVVAGGGAGGGGSNEGTANDVATPGGGNQSLANGTNMTGQNGFAYSGDGGGGGAGGGGFYGGAGQTNLNSFGVGNGGANYSNSSNRVSFALYNGTSGAANSGGGIGGLGTSSSISNASDFSYVNTLGKGGNAQGNGGTSPTANGNNGAVIIRYQGSPVATGGTITQSGGYTLHTFTTAGTSTFTANSASAVCVGSTTILTCATPNGVWSSSNPAIASINPTTGEVTGVTDGVVTITYTVTSVNGCVGTSTKQFTVNPLPIIPAITGNTTVCDNATTLLSNSLSGGVWSSATPSRATINTVGLVSGVSAGTSTITYTYTDLNGCTNSNTAVVTINASPVVAGISGASGVCIGSSTTFTNSTVGGTWSSSNNAVATINSSGVISSVAIGTSTISYTVTNANSCTVVVTRSITVNPLPTVTASATAPTVCAGTATTLNGGGASSYTWTGGVTNNVSFTPAATTTYTVTGTNGNGCVNTANITVTVNPLPVITITPSATVICAGQTANLTASGATTYTWSGFNGAPIIDQISVTPRLAAGLHRLRTAYAGSAIRIRRGSDNAEQDFGFVGDDLDTAAIRTFLGVATGFVRTLYDQSGLNNHLTQTNNSLQPLFVFNSLNGKPTIRIQGGVGQTLFNNTNFTLPFTVIYAARQNGPTRGRMLTSSNGSSNWLLGWWGGHKAQAHFDSWVSTPGSNPANSNPFIYTGAGTSGSYQFYENGTLLFNNGGGSTGPNGISMGAMGCCAGERSDGDFTDLFVFNSVLSNANRQIVENNIGAYYGITSGATVSGASQNATPTTTTNYTVYGTDLNGCVGTATQTITVNPKPNAGADINFVCGASVPTSITGSPNTGTWTALTTNPTGAALSTTTSGVATVSFDNLASGTYSFIYTLATGCSDTMTITARPKPNAGADQAICILNVATGVTLTSNVTGTWSALTGNPGTATIASPSLASTLVNNFSAEGNFFFQHLNNGCTDTVKVTVTPAGLIGNYVWKDQNNDGLQNEPSSNGVNGITVELYKKDGLGAYNLFATSITANDGLGNPGYYSFGICEDGYYKIKVPTINPFTSTLLTNQDSTLGVDGNSDVYKSTGFGPEIYINTNGVGVAKTNNTVDAGYQICTKPIAGVDFNSCGNQIVTITGVSTTPSLPSTDGNWTALAGNPSGAVLSATNLGVATVQFDSLASGVFKFIYTVIGGCDDTLNITIEPKPYAGADLVEVCGGSEINISGLPAGGTWTPLASNTTGATVGSTLAGIAKITFANLVSSTYGFVYTTPFGCSDTMYIGTKPKPNAGVDKYLECGSPVIVDSIQATPIGGVWVAKAGNPSGVTLSNVSSGKAILNLPPAPVQGTWSFVYIAPNGCTDTLNYVIGVVGNPMPVVNMGTNPICLNGSVQLCPSVWGWSNYQWYKNGVAIAAPIGNSACITLQASDVGSYQVQATNGSACWSQLSNPIVVTYNVGCATTAFTANINTQYLSIDSGNVINATAQLQPQGGVLPYQYKASLANGTATATSKKGGNIVVNTTNGNYTYTAPIGFVGLDTFYITVCDATTPIPNCATQMYIVNVYSLSSSVTSGGGGGIESKTLGNVISQRLYGNALNNRKQDLGRTSTQFTKSTSIIVNGPSDLRLLDLVPATVLGTERAFISSPTDLVNFTNAVEVLSVDYTKTNINKAVAFGTRTLGDVYNHTKPICDRLKGSEILEVKQININGITLLAYKVKQHTGEIEHAINLNAGVKANRNTISVQSNWFTNSYVPDETMFNFQLWAVSYDMVTSMAKDIISKLQQNGTVQAVTNADMPRAYVSKGNRTGINLNLTIQNNTTGTTGYFELKEKVNENAVETIRQIPFTTKANGVSQVQLPVQDNYEASIYMYLNGKLTDLLYLSDGTWALDYNKNNTSITKFNVVNEGNPVLSNNELRLFRNVEVTGTTKDYISVYKTMKGGGLTQDVSMYNSLKFNANVTGAGSVKITIVKKGIQNWNDQYSYTLSLEGDKEYVVGLNQFKSATNSQALKATDVLAVNFGLNNSRGGTTTMNASLSKVRFSGDMASSAAALQKVISIYPNPVQTGRFTANFTSELDESLVLRVIEMASGKTVKTQFVQAKKGANQVAIELSGVVANGMYNVVVEGDNSKYQVQKLYIQRY